MCRHGFIDHIGKQDHQFENNAKSMALGNRCIAYMPSKFNGTALIKKFNGID